MADQYVGPEQLVDVQRLALWQHKSTTGPRLPAGDVRAAMLLRANSLMKGVSGIRIEIIERFAAFSTPACIRMSFERGSIGASGDLVPLAYIRRRGASAFIPPSSSISTARRWIRTRRWRGSASPHSSSSPRRVWRSTTAPAPRPESPPTRRPRP
jgi:hypothetical protein